MRPIDARSHGLLRPWNESCDPTSEASQAPSHRALLHPWHDPSDRLAGFPSRQRSLHVNDDDDDDSDDMLAQDVEKAAAVYGPTSGHSPMSYEDLPDERSYQDTTRHDAGFAYPEDSNISKILATSKVPSLSSGRDAEHVDAPGTAASTPRAADHHDDAPFHIIPMAKTVVQYPHETIEQPRRSQVIRKINSGFEILHPGSLGLPRPKTEIVLGGAVGAAEQSSKRISRRLLRRRGDADLGKN